MSNFIPFKRFWTFNCQELPGVPPAADSAEMTSMAAGAQLCVLSGLWAAIFPGYETWTLATASWFLAFSSFILDFYSLNHICFLFSVSFAGRWVGGRSTLVFSHSLTLYRLFCEVDQSFPHAYSICIKKDHSYYYYCHHYIIIVVVLLLALYSC